MHFNKSVDVILTQLMVEQLLNKGLLAGSGHLALK